MFDLSEYACRLEECTERKTIHLQMNEYFCHKYLVNRFESSV